MYIVCKMISHVSVCVRASVRPCVCVYVYVCGSWRNDHIDRVYSNSLRNNEVDNFNFSISNRSCIHSEPGMQLLLSISCSSSSFDGVNVLFIIALYQLQKLKARVLIKMMYSNIVE